LTVPRPRIESVRRHVPGKASIGDHAVARLDPGLVELLSRMGEVGGHALAACALPLGIATSAALAILSPTQVNGVYWTSRQAECHWLERAGPQDAVLGEARLVGLTERAAHFEVSARTDSGKSLFHGKLELLAMRDGRPVGYLRSSQYEAMRSRLAGIRRKPNQTAAGILQLVAAPESIPLGKTAILELAVTPSFEEAEPVTVDLVLPYGAGLSAEATRAVVETEPGKTTGVAFVIRADRPDEVNLSRPWVVEIHAAGCSLSIPIAVPDPEPGRVFYILSEDCETFDGGPRTGDYKDLAACGNQNNFMDLEDYRIQMIDKPDRMNQIAERHGARWTHFWCVPQRFAVDWAARQSSTGEWLRIGAALDESIRRGSVLHEYAPHIHFDYEPDSPLPPQPRLTYDRATDGILPNQYYDPVTNPGHCYHDWDGSARGISYLKALGDWSDVSTKAGSLRKSLQYLARLQANRRVPVVARTGSYDFGKTPEDQAISTAAYLANGLCANSDAYRHARAPAREGQMFWCAERERQEPVADLREVRLVQLGITLDTSFGVEDEVNGWFAQHWPSCDGPGVHALLFTTHAMFMRGEPDPLRSLEGGAFAVLDRHLAWVRANYPQVRFATASEVVLDFLDYYTPTLRAHVEPRLSGGDLQQGRYEFPIRLLGRGIRVSPAHPVAVILAAPPCFAPDEIAELRVISGGPGGRILAARQGFDAKVQPTISVMLFDREAPMFLAVLLRPGVVLDEFAASAPPFFDPPEPPQPDLFRLRPASPTFFPPDLIRLLMNPIAGHTEPLGRRTHPLGSLLVGYAAIAASPDTLPDSMKIHWVKPIGIESTLIAESRELSPGVVMVEFRDESRTVVAEVEVRLRGRFEDDVAASRGPDSARFEEGS
jgi:hypothetical protein